jgi:hypothetical protein
VLEVASRLCDLFRHFTTESQSAISYTLALYITHCGRPDVSSLIRRCGFRVVLIAFSDGRESN